MLPACPLDPSALPLDARGRGATGVSVEATVRTPTDPANALRTAVLALDRDAVIAALAAGANPSALDEDRQTPFHALLRQGWPSSGDPERAAMARSCHNPPEDAVAVLDLLLDAGLSVNATNGTWETLLGVALDFPFRATQRALRERVAVHLVARGADVVRPGHAGSILWMAMGFMPRTPFPATPDGGAPVWNALVRAMLDRGATVQLPALRATPPTTDGVQDLRGVRYTTPQGRDMLGALPDGSETLALRAVRSGSMAALDHVLALGADVRAEGTVMPGKASTLGSAREERWTPAQLAAALRWDEGLDRVIQALLDQAPQGQALLAELARPVWQTAEALVWPGRQRLERAVLNQGLREMGLAPVNGPVAHRGLTAFEGLPDGLPGKARARL